MAGTTPAMTGWLRELYASRFLQGGRTKAGAELTRNKRPVADFHVIFRHGRACPGHPRGSACTRPECLADRAPEVEEPAVRWHDGDGRDDPGHDAGGGRCCVARFI